MPEKYTRKFRIKHDEAWGWHIGLCFCIGPKDVIGKREIYLLICLGRHDISIGILSEFEYDED